MRNFLSSTWDFFFSSTSLYGFVDCKSCENTFFLPPNKYCGGKMKRGGIVGCDSLVVTSATVIICVASLGQSRGKSGRWPRLWEPWNKWINEKGHLAATLCSDKAVVHISCVFIARVLFAVLLASDCKHIPAVCVRAPRQVWWGCEGSPPPPGDLGPSQWKFRNPAVAGWVLLHCPEVPWTATST